MSDLEPSPIVSASPGEDPPPTLAEAREIKRGMAMLPAMIVTGGIFTWIAAVLVHAFYDVDLVICLAAAALFTLLDLFILRLILRKMNDRLDPYRNPVTGELRL